MAKYEFIKIYKLLGLELNVNKWSDEKFLHPDYGIISAFDKDYTSIFDSADFFSS